MKNFKVVYYCTATSRWSNIHYIRNVASKAQAKLLFMAECPWIDNIWNLYEF